MDPLSTLALGLGAAWASGISLYATVLVLGGLDLFGVIDLPSSLEVLSNPGVLFVAGVLYFIEFFADKLPGVDTISDFLHTFIRVPAGSLLGAGAVSDLGLDMNDELLIILALIAGGAVAFSSHATKAGGRVIVNTSPEPMSNIIVSFTEDVMVVAGLLLAVFQPVIFLASFAVFALFVAWLLPKIWRGIRGFFNRFRDPAANLPWRAEAWAPDLPVGFGPTPDPEHDPPAALIPPDDDEGPSPDHRPDHRPERP